MSLRRSIWISTSTITAAAILPCSAAPITSIMKAARWLACGLTCTPSAATRILWPPADGCTVMSRIPSLPISIMRITPMSGTVRAASMRPRSSAFSSTLTSMMTRAFRAFLDVTSDSDADFSDFRERYCGRWDSEEEFAQHLADELCMFDNVPESITRFFDFKAFARELFMSDYDMGDGGHVFRTC